VHEEIGERQSCDIVTMHVGEKKRMHFNNAISNSSQSTSVTVDIETSVIDTQAVAGIFTPGRRKLTVKRRMVIPFPFK
jgi:hypothetical protein